MKNTSSARARTPIFVALFVLALGQPLLAQEADDGTSADEDVGSTVGEDSTTPAESEQSEAAEEEGLYTQVELLTDIPLHMGGRVAVETAQGLRGSLSVGILPGAYVDLINAVVMAFDGYNQATADLIQQSLQNSLVVRVHAGYRPWSHLGFYVDLGYTLATLGGDVANEGLISAVTGQEAPGITSLADEEYAVNSTLHLIGLEVGWQWVIAERWTIRTALGGAFTVAAASTVEAEFSVPRAGTALVDAFEGIAEQYLDDTYTSYVHTATVSVAAGYRF